MEIFKLFGSILVDSSEAEKSISKTGKEAETTGSKLKNGIATAAKWGTAIVGAATAVGGAMVKVAKDTAATMDTIDKASQRMNISAESYQELSHAANLCGVEMSTMEKAAKKLEGTDLNMDDALNQIWELGSAEERAAKASELFGDAVAYQMTPMLNASAEDMAAMRQEANDLGLVMSQDSVTAGAAMNDMFTKVEGSLKTLKTSLAAEFMPYVMEILQWIIDNIPMIKDTVKSVADTVMPIVQTVMDFLMEIIPPIFDKIKQLLDWLIPYIKPIMDGIQEAVEAVMSLINGDLDGFIEHIKNALIKLGTTLFNLGKDIMQKLWDGFKSIWSNISNWFSNKLDEIKQKFQSFSLGNLLGGLGGSHAAGLNYVPYDGYVAELHKGETVLSASNTQDLKSDIINGVSEALGNFRGASGPIELTLNIDGQAFARATYDATQNELTRRGSNLVMGV